MKILDKLERELERLRKLEPPRENNYWEWKDNIEQQRMIIGRIGALKLINRGNE